MAKQRIEYIDAMRGLTMILVVYSHIFSFCLGDKDLGFNNILFLFRMPCFFFISGWLFEQVGRQWNSASIRNTIRHKFMVQIIPTLIFLLLLAPPPLLFSRLGMTKGGYWFTFALFEFFVLCIFSERCLKKWGGVFALVISVSAYCYDVYYNRFFRDYGLMTDLMGFLSFATWRYYLFFYIGTWVKNHFDTFIARTNKVWVMLVAVIVFILIALNPQSEDVFLQYLIFSIGGILGMTLVFTAFRCFSSVVSRISPLKYIGTRTLDIYLLHYFFLPRFLLQYAPQLSVYDSRWLELFVGLAIASVVVGICLLVSYVIRLSPFLGHYLFGVKYEKQQK